MYMQEYALLKCKCVNSKMHVHNTVNQTILLYISITPLLNIIIIIYINNSPPQPYYYTLTYIIASRM